MWKIATICGIDGSGKTTQAKMLEKYLMGRGFRVKRVWFRWFALISYPFLALCRLLGYTRWKTINRGNVKYAEHRFYLNKAIAKIWPWLFTVDILIYYLFKIKSKMILKSVVLCDRFIPDMLVDLMCETKDYLLYRRLVGRVLLSLIPKKSKLVIIDVSENMAYHRKHDIPNINYLKERRKMYTEFLRLY
jgi:dTMP kinase